MKALVDITFESMQEALLSLPPKPDHYTVFLHPATTPLLQRKLAAIPCDVPGKPAPWNLLATKAADAQRPGALVGHPIVEMDTLQYGTILLQNDSALQRWRAKPIGKRGRLEPKTWQVIDLLAKKKPANTSAKTPLAG